MPVDDAVGPVPFPGRDEQGLVDSAGLADRIGHRLNVLRRVEAPGVVRIGDQLINLDVQNLALAALQIVLCSRRFVHSMLLSSSLLMFHSVRKGRSVR